MNFNYVPPAVADPTNLPERVATILNGLRDLAARHAARNWAMIPMTVLLSAYLGSVIRRFTSLAARLAAGPIGLRPPRPRTPHPGPAREKGSPKSRLPSRFGWMIEWLGYHAVGRGAQLRFLFTDDPEMAALMAASPQVGRMFRPLCRMLRLEPAPDLPPSLFPPRRAAKGPPAEAAPPDIAQPSLPSLQGSTLQSRTEGACEPGAARETRVRPWQDGSHAGEEPAHPAAFPNQA